MRLALIFSAACLSCSAMCAANKGKIVSSRGIMHDEWGAQETASKFTLKEDDEDSAARNGKALKAFQAKGRKIAPPSDFMKALKPQDVKLKKESDGDRRLSKTAASIKLHNLAGGGKIPASKKETAPEASGKRLGGPKTDTDFVADVAAPVLLGNKLRKASDGNSNRRLQTAECFTLDDGSLACVQEDFPGDGFSTVFLDCPVSSPTVLDCLSCTILGGLGEVDPANAPQCSSCSLCSDSIAFDCSNIGEGTCIRRDCAGNCFGSGGSNPNPTPSPTPPAPSPTSGGSSSGGVSCQEDQGGNIFCVFDGYPVDGWLTVFQDCPATTDNALQCGRCSIVPPDGTPNEIDLVNDPQCNSCTVCSDRAAYDCSNLDSGDCSVLDCGGTCSDEGGFQPTFAPPTGPSPTFAPPTTAPPTGGTSIPQPKPTSPTGTSPPTDPDRPVFPGPIVTTPASSASVKSMGLLSFAVAAVGSMVFGFF